MQKIDALIGKSLEVIITVCLSITVLITFLQVLFRYVFNISSAWAQEVLMISFIFSVFFGAALALRNNEHLQVDLLDKSPEKVRKTAKVLEMLIVGVMIIVLIIYGGILVQDNFESGKIVGILPIKMAYVYMVLPISGGFMLYYHLKQVIKWLR